LTDPITFASEGTVLRGRLYPGKGAGRRPAVVMAHGFSAVAAQLEPQARAFSDAGYTVLAYDNPGFGLSEGFPRQEVDPARQVRAYRDAVTLVRGLPDVRPDRIALWGSSFSGGHVLMAGALDPRVAAVVSQAPFVAGWDLLAQREDVDDFVAALFAEREARSGGAPPTLIPVVAEGEELCALPGEDGYSWFTSTGGPTWRNEVTLSSFELVRAYEPGWWVHRIAPRPLLMIVADEDVVTPTEHALAVFTRAAEPKELLRVAGGHFDVYSGTGFEQSIAATLAFLSRSLG
jgi:uncharacterized protein